MWYGTNITAMEYKIKEIAGRIRELRQISGLSVEEMASRTGVTPEEYALAQEEGWIPIFEGFRP